MKLFISQNVSDPNYWTFGVWNNGGTDSRLRFVLFENEKHLQRFYQKNEP